jgi:signal transduction histidine kinase/ligand-binding sensor domain-containing protein
MVSSGALWIAALLGPPSMAVNPSHQITQFGHTAWRVRDGQLPGRPTALTQTTDGFLWIGTESGLVRFDGVRFMPWRLPAGVHLPDDRIVALLGAKDGSLWIGTGNGLAQWKDGKLTVFTTVGRFAALVEDQHGAVWAGHTRAPIELPPLCRFSDGVFDCVKPSHALPVHYVGALHEDRNGELWIGGDSGVCRWRSGNPECHPIPVMADSGDKFGVFSIADDSEANLWAGTGAIGIWRLASGHWTRYSEASSPGLDSEALLADRRSGVWIGTLRRGLLRLAGGRIEQFTRADGLSGDDVTGIFEDREGNVWAGTNSGLDRFRDVKVTTLTSREGLPGSTILSVAAAREGGVWIAEHSAVFRFMNGTILESWAAGQGLPGNTSTSLLEDSRGRLWVGIDNGLVWRERDRFFQVRMPDGSSLGVVRALTEDRDGSLWISTIDPRRALVRVRDGRVVESVPVERFGGQNVSAILADPGGGVWIGLIDSELKLYKDGRLDSYAPKAPGSNRIRSLFLDSRGLWEVTNLGLRRFRNGRLDTLDTTSGLPCNDIESAVTGDDGSLWLKTVCGLVSITPGALDSWSENTEARIEVRVLDAFDGAHAGLSPFTPRSAKSLDGRLWFAIETGGLQALDPKNLNENVVPPPIQILGVIADRNPYPPGTPVRLPPHTRDVEIDYTALSLTVPEKIRFRYRLEGADEQWRDAGNRREASYSNLKPGSYRFSVLACNNDGVWSSDAATLAFSIRPAFYQTFGFLGVCVAAVAGLGWAGYRLRVRQVRATLDRRFEERLAERSRIARELHDTLLQGFISASMQLHVVLDQLPLPADSPHTQRLNRVLDLMGKVIEEGRNAVRGLRAPGKSSDDLENAFSRIAEELDVDGSVRFRVVGQGHARPLSGPVREEVYRIGREALVNAFHHAKAGVIEVEVEFAPGHVRLLVRDDGVGIDPRVLESGREGHWGLPGMRERAERIGSRLRVWSREGAGTEIELSVPASIAFGEN